MATTAVAQRDLPDDLQRLARRQKALRSVFGPEFLQSFASPYMVIEDHLIECPVAIRFFKRDFSWISKQLYVEYQFRSWDDFDQTLLAEYCSLVTRKLQDVKTLITNTILRLQKLLEQEGHQADLSLWAAPLHCDVPIIAMQARSYLDVLRLIDKVYLLAATANLLGVIDSSQRAQAEYICKKAVRAFRAAVRSEVSKLYQEARRVVRERTVAAADPRAGQVVQQQADGVKEFAVSSNPAAIGGAGNTPAGDAAAGVPVVPESADDAFEGVNSNGPALHGRASAQPGELSLPTSVHALSKLAVVATA